MSKNRSSIDMNKDFQEFLSCDEAAPPVAVSERIIGQIKADLNPGFMRVFTKLALVHAFVGSLSLLFCPQFGIAPLGHEGLKSFYMMFGPHVCLAACGATFIIGSALLACLILRPEELRALRRTKYLQIVGLGVASLAVLMLFGEFLTLSMLLAWFMGLVISGIAALEIGFQIRALQWR